MIISTLMPSLNHLITSRKTSSSPTNDSANTKKTAIDNHSFLNEFFLVGYVEERLWWPIQSSNIGRKKKAKR